MSATQIPAGQRSIHVSTEAISVLLMAPFFVWLATRNRPLTEAEKRLLLTAAAGSVIVDGWLLYRFAQLEHQK